MFRNFVFSSCPVWPRIAPTASTNQVLRFNGVFWAYLTGFRPLKSSPGPFSPEAAAPDTFFLVLCGPAGLPDIRVDLGFPAATRASPYKLGGSPGPKEEDREEDPTERLKRHRRHHPPPPKPKEKSQDFHPGLRRNYWRLSGSLGSGAGAPKINNLKRHMIGRVWALQPPPGPKEEDREEDPTKGFENRNKTHPSHEPLRKIFMLVAIHSCRLQIK